MEPTTQAPAPSNNQALPVSLPKIERPFITLKSTWDMFVQNWKKLVPVAIIPSVATYLGTVFFSFGNIFFSILGIISVIAGVVLSIAAIAAMVKAVERLSIDPTAQISIKEYYKIGFNYFWSIIVVGIISGLVSIGGFVLLIIPGIIVSVFVAFYNYALIIDGKKGLSAFIESYQLVRGRWLAIFGRAMLVGLVGLLVTLIAGIIVSLFGGKEAPVAISGLVDILSRAIISPISVIFIYKVYSALKAVRQQDIDTKKFKGVLIGFSCVGALAIVSAVAITPVVMTKNIENIRANVEAARNDAEAKSLEVQRLIQEGQSVGTE